MRRPVVLLGACALLAAAGCGDDPRLKAQLAGRHYVGVDASDRRAVPVPSRMKLIFGNEEMSASGGCNDTDGTYTVGGGELQLADDALSTLMACVDSSSDQDEWLNELLDGSAAFELRDRGSVLHLQRGDRSATFELSRARGAAAPIDGVQWQATAASAHAQRWVAINRELTRPVLRINGRRATIFTGCNRGTATVRVRGLRATDTVLVRGPHITFGTFTPTTHRPCRGYASQVDRIVRDTLDGAAAIGAQGAGGISLIKRGGPGLWLTTRPPEALGRAARTR